jgi:hypothetical protein
MLNRSKAAIDVNSLVSRSGISRTSSGAAEMRSRTGVVLNDQDHF